MTSASRVSVADSKSSTSREGRPSDFSAVPPPADVNADAEGAAALFDFFSSSSLSSSRLTAWSSNLTASTYTGRQGRRCCRRPPLAAAAETAAVPAAAASSGPPEASRPRIVAAYE